MSATVEVPTVRTYRTLDGFLRYVVDLRGGSLNLSPDEVDALMDALDAARSAA